MTVLAVRVLGRIRILRDDDEIELGPPARRALFGLLALAAGTPLARHELRDGLWPDGPPPSSTNMLQTHVKHLRRLLEPERPGRAPSRLLPSVGDGYALRLPADVLDLTRFRQLCRVADSADLAPAGVATVLAEALSMWHGPPLADVPTLADHPRVVRLIAERRQILARYADAMLTTGGAQLLLPVLTEEAAAHPLDESAQARLVRALQAVGQRAKAFDVYRNTRARLIEELGADPGPELSNAYRELLAPDATSRLPTAPTRAAAPAPASRPIWQLPADVPDFVDRTAELDVLDCYLQPGALVVLCGTAGVGKTALAVRHAHRTRERYPDGQLLIDLRGHDSRRALTPGWALGLLLEALGIPGGRIPIEPDRLAVRYRTALADRRMLIVLDDAAEVAQVRPLLPGASPSAVLVTSRDSFAGLVALQGARRLTLDPLPAPDARALLDTLIGPRAQDEPELVAELAERCARLPLALRVAAERAVSSAWRPLTALVAELTGQAPLDVLDPGGDPRAAVRQVFSWSHRRLDRATALTFRRLALHPGPHLSAPAVAALAGVPTHQADRMLDTLARAHLVQHADRERYGLHNLLRAYATELTRRHDSPMEQREAVGRLLAHYLATVAHAVAVAHPAWSGYRHGTPEVSTVELSGPTEARVWLDTERPNLIPLCQHAHQHGWPQYAVGLATHLHRYLRSGNHAEALAILTPALRAARDLGDQRAEAHLRTNLGDIYHLLGRYRAAARQRHRAREIFHTLDDKAAEASAYSRCPVPDQ